MDLFKIKAVELVDLDGVMGGQSGVVNDGVDTAYMECTSYLKWANGSDEEVSDQANYGDWISNC